MKKLIAILLSLGMVAVLVVGCKGTNPDAPNTSVTESSVDERQRGSRGFQQG